MTERAEFERQYGPRPEGTNSHHASVVSAADWWDIKWEFWQAGWQARSPEGPVDIPFSESPCKHSSQYAYTTDGGKHIICLVCEHLARSPEAVPEPDWPKRCDEASRVGYETGLAAVPTPSAIERAAKRIAETFADGKVYLREMSDYDRVLGILRSELGAGKEHSQ